METTRRNFMRATAASAVVTAFNSPFARAEETKRRYRTALIGSGWWGMNILNEAIASGHCDVVALCDVDRAQLDPALAATAAKIGRKPNAYADHKEMLDKEKPEIVIVATPDHWHPLQMIDAVNAGAHVYVEKPVGHTILEGRAMVNAARKTQRVVQVGTHRRVSPHNIAGMEFLKSGEVGKVGLVNCFIRYGGGEERPHPNEEVPEGLDWDRWCGPAPLRPFNRRIHPKGFRNFLDYANGTIADWGIHWFDQVLWWTEEKWPKRIHSSGGRPIKGPVVNHAMGQTSDAPDHQVATFEFENFTCTWDNRSFAGNPDTKHEEVGAIFYGTRGAFHMGWLGGWTFYPSNGREPVRMAADLHDPDHQNIRELWADFVECIETGRKPVSDIETGHLSTNMSLLAMISMKLGRSVAWDGEREIFPGDDAANALLRRDYREGYIYPET
jgi:predicted dehydrogenase